MEIGAEKYGTWKLKAGKAIYCKCLKSTGRIEGSESYIAGGDTTTPTIRKKEKKKPEKKEKVRKIKALVSGGFVYVDQLPAAERRTTAYKINKNQVFARSMAMFQLRASAKNLTFMTVSFPMGMSDDSIFQCFNTYLTRMRYIYKFRMYLWVTERQKNGTLHYHILVPQWLPFQECNRMMRVTLENELTKNPQLQVKLEKGKYNGVDCKPVQGNRKQLIAYITKYVMKSNAVFSRLAWHCSRIVSNLFTTYDAKEWGEIDSIFRNGIRIKKVIKGEYMEMIYYEQEQMHELLIVLNRWNELVYNAELASDTMLTSEIQCEVKNECSNETEKILF